MSRLSTSARRDPSRIDEEWRRKVLPLHGPGGSRLDGGRPPLVEKRFALLALSLPLRLYGEKIMSPSLDGIPLDGYSNEP